MATSSKIKKMQCMMFLWKKERILNENGRLSSYMLHKDAYALSNTKVSRFEGLTSTIAACVALVCKFVFFLMMKPPAKTGIVNWKRTRMRQEGCYSKNSWYSIIYSLDNVLLKAVIYTGCPTSYVSLWFLKE